MARTHQRLNAPHATPIRSSKKCHTLRTTKEQVDLESTCCSPIRSTKGLTKQARQDLYPSQTDMAKLPLSISRQITNASSSDAARRIRSMSVPSVSADRLTKTGRISKARKGRPVHICDLCQKIYTRAEHLRRHKLNHTQPNLECPVVGCNRRFYRDDLLAKHVEEHDALLSVPNIEQHATSEPPLPPVDMLGTIHRSPSIAHSAHSAHNYPEQLFGQRMEPPVPMYRPRTLSDSAISGASYLQSHSQSLYNSPIMYGNNQTASSFNLEVPQHAYTWHHSTSAPATFGQHSPRFDTIQTPVSTSSYGPPTATATTHHLDMSIATSPFSSYSESHQSAQPEITTYSYVTNPSFQDGFFGHALDPLLVRNAVQEPEQYQQLELFRLPSTEDSQQTYQEG